RACFPRARRGQLAVLSRAQQTRRAPREEDRVLSESLNAEKAVEPQRTKDRNSKPPRNVAVNPVVGHCLQSIVLNSHRQIGAGPRAEAIMKQTARSSVRWTQTAGGPISFSMIIARRPTRSWWGSIAISRPLL